MLKYIYFFLIILMLFPNLHAKDILSKRGFIDWEQFFGLYRAKILYSYDEENGELSVVLDDMSWYYEHHCPDYNVVIKKQNKYNKNNKGKYAKIHINEYTYTNYKTSYLYGYNSLFMDFDSYFKFIEKHKENKKKVNEYFDFSDERRISNLPIDFYKNFLSEYKVWQKFTNHPDYINIFYFELLSPLERRIDVKYLTNLGGEMWGKKDYKYSFSSYPFVKKIKRPYIIMERIAGPEICHSYSTVKEYFKERIINGKYQQRAEDEFTRWLADPTDNPKPKDINLPKYDPLFFLRHESNIEFENDELNFPSHPFNNYIPQFYKLLDAWKKENEE